MHKPLQILLVEDNPGDAELVREALREHGIEHEIKLASDGAEAEAYLARMGTSPDAPCPDLILLDLNLPKSGGHQVFAAFRANPLCASTPVIVLTSSNAPRDREQAASLRASRYFRKPSDLAEFLMLGQVIREVALEAGLPA